VSPFERLQNTDKDVLKVSMSALKVLFSLTLLGSLGVACSSDGGKPTTAANSGGASGSGGAAESGGTSGSGGTAPAVCSVDAGAFAAAGCQTCLEQQCCTSFQECLGDATCAEALNVHAACFLTPKQDPSYCFGNFNRAVSGDAGQLRPPILSCIVVQCSAACGGPQIV
jgi:hypothetical protein